MSRRDPGPIGFNLFEMNCVGHISHDLWVHPDNTRHRFNDIDFWTAEAKLLEEGLFDAVVADRERRVFTEPGKVRRINHAGKHFRVEGPHLAQPSPQRTPVLFQAGSSPTGKRFAAKHAEGVFVVGHSIESYRENVADLRRLAVEHGRDPYDIHTYAMAVVIVGRTREDAERKARELELLSRAEGYLAHYGGVGVDLTSFPPSTRVADIVAAERAAGRDRSVQSRFFDTDKTVGEVLHELTRFDRGPFFALGTPEEVADQIEGWVRDTDLDGFNLQQFLTPGNARLPERHHGARFRGGAHLEGQLDLARPTVGALHEAVARG